MISVAIIGILSAAAIPAFRMYQFRSKRSEAYANLESIRKAQVSYKAEYDNFVQAAPSPGILLGADKQNWHARGHFPPVPGTGFDELGWRPEGPTYFDYDTVVDDDGSGAYFTAAAYGDVDGDGFVSAFLYAHEDGAGPAPPKTTAATRSSAWSPGCRAAPPTTSSHSALEGRGGNGVPRGGPRARQDIRDDRVDRGRDAGARPHPASHA
jgi:type II secretory pathway pseudopilin PulG